MRGCNAAWATPGNVSTTDAISASRRLRRRGRASPIALHGSPNPRPAPGGGSHTGRPMWCDPSILALVDHATALLDWLACAARGREEPAARAARTLGPGLSERVAAAGAAGHVLDFDDTYLPGLAH